MIRITNRDGGSIGPIRYILNGEDISVHKFFKHILDSSPRRVLFFIHGFNVTENELINSHGLMERLFLREGDLLISFDWASRGLVPFYRTDRIVASESAQQLAGIFCHVLGKMNQNCTIEICIIAHSMGSYVLAKALQNAHEWLGAPMAPVQFNETVLIAPDLDDNALERDRVGEHICTFSRRVTVYHTRNDSALAFSAAKRLGTTGGRLGRRGPANVDLIPKNTVIIDCTVADQGHSWLDSIDVIDDVRSVISGDDRDVLMKRHVKVPGKSYYIWKTQ